EVQAAQPLIELPNAEIDLPIRIGERGLSRKAQVQPQRSDRSGEADRRAIAALKIAHRNPVGMDRDLATVEKRCAGEPPEERTAQLDRALEEAETAQRLIGRAERTDAPQTIA